jgi:FKBP-type peptidyl-prolyl cis-trans isomerase FkpA
MTKNPAVYLTLSLSLFSIIACAQGVGSGSSAAPAKLETEDQKTIYTLGYMLGQNIKVFNFKPEELTLVQKGLADSVAGTKSEVDLDTYRQKVNQMAQTRMTATAELEKKKGDEYAEKAAKEPGATKTATGIVIRTLTPGTGASPAADDTVKVNYEGRLIDGTVFDASAKHGGQPAEFPLNHVVPCWTEAVQKMKVGEKAQVVCPASVAYGDRGQPPTIPGGATLVFDIELVGIGPKQAAPEGMPAGHPPVGGEKPAEPKAPAKPKK